MRTVMTLAAALALATVAQGQTPAKTPAATAAPAMKSTTAPKMATHTTKTGKKITYDCSKKGNMNKTACKK